jgi:hypothetical protein
MNGKSQTLPVVSVEKSYAAAACRFTLFTTDFIQCCCPILGSYSKPVCSMPSVTLLMHSTRSISAPPLA